MKVTVLAGGVGAARFLEGVVQVVPQRDVTVISNTGDDEDFFGLRVSPDIDIVIYTLAGEVDRDKGWGLRDETFATLEALRRFGYETWFNLGDRDLATLAHRSDLLRQGRTLSHATASIARAFDLEITILPVSDDRIRTMVTTAAGTLTFQEYFVKRRTADDVQSVHFKGAATAKPAPGVLEAITRADVVCIAPSNPVVSIGPLLAVHGVADALRGARGRVVAVSPIIGGKTVKGPADRMMAALGIEPSAAGVARSYAEFATALVLDEVDRGLSGEVEACGVRAVVAPTLMSGPAEKRALAEVALRAVS